MTVNIALYSFVVYYTKIKYMYVVCTHLIASSVSFQDCVSHHQQ